MTKREQFPENSQSKCRGGPPPGKGLKVINMSARSSLRALNVQCLAECLAHSRHTINAWHTVVGL